jgi:DNA-binding transcriptional LysR family regulator
MDWDLLRAFLAVARTGRLSTAARRLGVEHTTIARRLASLEAELGAKLFYRTATGHRMTTQGQAILASAEAMERAALRIDACAREGSDVTAGRVRVALIDEFASHWLAPLLPELRARHPGLELQLLVGIQHVDLTRGEAEIAVRSPRPQQPGLSRARLARLATDLYASRALVRKRPLRVTDLPSLRGLPLLVYTPEHHALQSAPWFQPIFAAADIALRTNSTHALVAATRADAGVAVLPRFVARRYPDLVAVSAEVATDEMWLVTHPEYRRDPRVRATAAFLREVAGRLE